MKPHIPYTAIHAVLFVFAIFIFGACLEENPRDRIDEEQAFSNTTNLYLNTVANLYNYIGGNSDSQGLQGTARGVYDLNTFTSDEAIVPTRGGDWYDGGLWQALYTHQFLPSLQPFEGTWNYLYKVIVKCNQAIEHLKSFDTDNHSAVPITKYIAEARAIRAMYYYYLLDSFGNVPIVMTSSIAMEEAQQSTRNGYPL